MFCLRRTDRLFVCNRSIVAVCDARRPRSEDGRRCEMSNNSKQVTVSCLYIRTLFETEREQRRCGYVVGTFGGCWDFSCTSTCVGSTDDWYDMPISRFGKKLVLRFHHGRTAITLA
jgi:hypothetical protein